MAHARPIAIAALTLFVIALILLGSTGRDDSHITYYVSDAIAAGDGIVNYNGDRIEQSSTLLYTTVLAGAVALTGVQAATLGPILSTLLLILTVPLMAWILRRHEAPPALALLPVLAPPALYWSFSGMENSLYLLVLLLAALTAERFLSTGRTAWLAGAGLALAAVVLTRPEAVIVALCIGAGTLVLAPSVRAWAMLMGTTVLAGAAAIALRLGLGLRVFPNPVYAKQDLGLSGRLHGGYSHFALTAQQMTASSVVATLCGLAAVVFLVRGWRTRDAAWRFAGLCLLVAAVIACFAFLSGGDWMENGRFLVPFFFFTLLAAFLLLPARARGPVAILWLAAVALDLARMARPPYGGLPLFAPYSYQATAYDPSWLEGFNTIHARDMVFADRFLQVLEDDPREEITIASIQAGLVPYYLFHNSTKSLRFVDLYGLSTDDVQGCDFEWHATFDPYRNLDAIRACVGIDFDYMYDIDANWARIERLTGMGCEEVLRQDLIVDTVPWKEPNDSRLFLARCAWD